MNLKIIHDFDFKTTCTTACVQSYSISQSVSFLLLIYLHLYTRYFILWSLQFKKKWMYALWIWGSSLSSTKNCQIENYLVIFLGLILIFLLSYGHDGQQNGSVVGNPLTLFSMVKNQTSCHINQKKNFCHPRALKLIAGRDYGETKAHFWFYTSSMTEKNRFWLLWHSLFFNEHQTIIFPLSLKIFHIKLIIFNNTILFNKSGARMSALFCI